MAYSVEKFTFDCENDCFMLNELHISNYRLFDDLRIPDLGQVNLIAGKNNTGKTALLEALRIWVAKGNETVINHILKVRGQFTPNFIESYGALFPRGGKQNKIIINELRITVDSPTKLYKVTLHPPRPIGPNNKTSIDLTATHTPDYPQDVSVFLPFINGKFPLQNLWDKIALTPHEKEVWQILQLVEPRLERMEVKEENSRVLLDGDFGPVPLKSLGEGVNRMLLIAVALVSAKNSMLLIDEFEAGLHHSVQEMLWEKIFFYAQKWNIQVFVTTHSMDTVRTFYSVADRPENKGKGRFFRLQRNSKDQIESVSYGEEELATALEFDLETR